MQKVLVKNQPVLNRILNKINKSSSNVQAYLLSHANEDDLEKYAILFTKVLVCPNNYKNDCLECNICKRISSGNFGELKIIKPENGVIKKDVVINLRDSYQTSSIEGKNQVYIIHNVECLNPAAANSLLKFLEEPESNTIAIFTTTNLNKVMNTIVSRCQIIKLNNNKVNKGLSYVQNITSFDEEQISIVMDFIFDLENKKVKAISQMKESFLERFDTKEKLKSALTIILLMYKDALNYKMFENMDYFNNETGIKNISSNQNTQTITKKIAFILENISKLEYNVNVLLFVNNLLIGIGEITDGKSSRN